MKVYQNSTYSMGTRFNLLLPDIDTPEGDMLFSYCIKELNHIENMLSCFSPTSDISQINKNAFRNPIKINDELFSILKNCLNYFKLTQGAFDISLGKIIDIWSENENMAEINELMKNVGTDKIILNSHNNTVHFSSPNIKINLGGYGKGYALQKIQDLLKENNISSAYISFGESSVSCIGKHPHGDYWPVGIQDYNKKDKCIATFKLVNMSVSTSGNMENSNHIIHPRKGKPIQEKMMVTVKSNSPTDAEVLSTALMLANKAERQKIQNAFPEIEIITNPVL